MLTERQSAILGFMREHQRRHGLPPSTREIQRHFGFASQTTVMDHLQALAAKGQLEKLGARRWGLRPREVADRQFALPVYGAIPAGLPAQQEQEPEETLRVDPAVFGLRRPPPPHHCWALRVQGDSMVDAHILDGDLVVLERREPRPGDIIAALVDETSTTLKRLVLAHDRPVLRAANKRYRDIVPERLESQGVVVGVIRRQPRAEA